MNELSGSVAIDHLAATVDELGMVRDRIAALKKRETELVAQLRAGIGTHQFGTVGNEEAVRLDSRVNTHLDRDAVKALIGPEALGTVTRLTPYVAVKIVGKFRASGK